jgi:hypothetical protein
VVGIAHTVARASESVEDFRGDYEQLATMVQASWAQNPTPPYLYTAEFLADCLRYPGAGCSLAPTIYDRAEPVAFAVGYPRRVIAGGAERRVLISTLLTVAPEHKASGYGIVVWSELMRRAAQAGFDGVVNYCTEGGAMDRMIRGGCRLLGLPVLRFGSFSYLTRSLWGPVPDSAESGCEASAQDLCRAAAKMPERADLSRLWTHEEAAWQLSRLGGVSAKGGTDSDPAVLTAYVIPIADAVRTRCLVIEDVLWGNLTADDRQALVRRLITKAAAAGARAAIVPRVGYADVQPFLASGFLASDHTIHAYLTIWSEPGVDRPPKRCYIDVI